MTLIMSRTNFPFFFHTFPHFLFPRHPFDAHCIVSVGYECDKCIKANVVVGMNVKKSKVKSERKIKKKLQCSIKWCRMSGCIPFFG
jgi:hypothetical protein